MILAKEDEPSAYASAMFEFDVFLSHASEDKEVIVLPLAAELQGRGISVWLDDQQLTLGDSLSEKIDDGLLRAQFGVVVLSHAFFSKRWPRRELDGLVTRETVSGAKVILPVWHELSVEDVMKYSAPLAGKLAVSTTHGLSVVADRIAAALDAAAVVQAGGEAGTSSSEGSVGANRTTGGHRESLSIETDFEFQGGMGLVSPDSARIAWDLSLQVTYLGSELLVVYDIIPTPPWLIGEGDQESRRIQLVRVENEAYYDRYGYYGDMVAARSGLQETRETHDVLRAEEWPLILRPGDRYRVVLHHKYELRADDEPLVFADNEELLAVLGAYFGLDRDPSGGYLVGARVFPARIETNRGVWDTDVAFGVLPVGASFRVPDLDGLEEILGSPIPRRRRWCFWRGRTGPNG